MDGRELGNTYFHAMPDSVRFEYENNRLHGSVGLTLRQYFAGLVMQGLLANGQLAKDMQAIGWDDMEKYPRWAVEHADALLRELAKEN